MASSICSCGHPKSAHSDEAGFDVGCGATECLCPFFQESNRLSEEPEEKGWCKTHAIEMAKMFMEEEMSFEWKFEGHVGDVFSECLKQPCESGPCVTIKVDTGED